MPPRPRAGEAPVIATPRKNASRRVTLAMVAAKAQVSVMTASRVLRDDPSVGPCIRQVVLDSAKALRYRPNMLARGLRNQSTHVVSLFLYELSRPFFGRLAEALSDRLYEAGLLPVIANSGARMDQMISEVFPCGSIMMTPDPDAARRLYERQALVALTPLPLGHEGRPVEDADVLGAPYPVCAIDFRPAYAAMGREMVARGVGRYGGVGRPTVGMRKFREAIGALDAAGAVPVPRGGLWTDPGAAVEAVRAGRVDALFCQDDMVALRLLADLARAGLRVPDDVILAGCDGTIRARGLMTARVDFAGVAEAAVGMLTDQLSAPSAGDVRPRIVSAAMEICSEDDHYL